MLTGNVRCKRNCGNSIKRELIEDSENWAETEQGYLCPSCNPDGPSW